MQTCICNTDIGHVENRDIVETVTKRYQPVEAFFQLKTSNVLAHDCIETSDFAIRISHRRGCIKLALEAIHQRLNPKVQIAGHDKTTLHILANEFFDMRVELDLGNDGLNADPFGGSFEIAG